MVALTGAAPPLSRCRGEALEGPRRRATASIIIDQFEGRAMWPMTDAEAILFIITVALLLALAQVAGGWPSHHTAGSPAVSERR